MVKKEPNISGGDSVATTKTFTLLALLLLISFPIPGPVNAGQNTREELIREYREADLNKDGYVDEEEYRRFIKKRFESMDSNRDEMLERAELKELKKEEFVLTDRNKDRRISFREFLKGRLRFFNEADVNKDALLSLEEYVKMKLMDPVKW